jgi:hypothetical protein
MSSSMRVIAFLVLQSLLIATAGCIAVSNLDHGPTPVPTLPDRTDCGAILGTAFHSETERQWFAENCSEWTKATLGEVEAARATPTAPPPTATPPPTASPEPTPTLPPPPPGAQGPAGLGGLQPPPPADNRERCAQQAGRPNLTPEDQAWFVEHCLTANGQPGTPGESPQCAALRGRPYESDSQRAWYLANCRASSTGAQQDPDPGGPDRTDCNAIRGTPYRSATERDWYQQHCNG